MSNKTAYNSIQHLLPLFFKSWWLDAVCGGDWDVAIVKSEDEILAIWPYQTEKKFGFTLLRNPLLTPYLGPAWISTKPENTGWIEALWNQIPKVDFAQWTCIPEQEETNFFARQNMEHKERVTYFIDLKSNAEALWANLHSTRRNGIRKGQQELVIAKRELSIEEFMQWHSPSFEQKNKQYPYSNSFLNKVILAAKENNASICYTAKDALDKTHGILWLAYDSHKMYYLLSATAPEANRGAMALLAWEAIQEAKAMGLAIFDFEGSMDAGIARFFQRFGGAKMNYNEFSITYSPLWKLKSKLIG